MDTFIFIFLKFQSTNATMTDLLVGVLDGTIKGTDQLKDALNKIEESNRIKRIKESEALWNKNNAEIDAQNIDLYEEETQNIDVSYGLNSTILLSTRSNFFTKDGPNGPQICQKLN